jgi:putative ABC transport system substrate-binding protein
LSLLYEAVPSVHRIAVLPNHRKVVEAGMSPLRRTAAEAGLELFEIWVESPNEYAAAFETMRGTAVDAIVIVPAPELNRDSEQLGRLAAKAGLPAIGGFRESAQAGLTFGYGPNREELYRQAESCAERIFNGAQAGELPFQGPTRLDFVISMRTAKAVGVSIPPSLLVGAEVIE